MPGIFIRVNKRNAVEMRSQTRPASHHQTWKVAARARGNRQRCLMQPAGEPCLQAQGRLDAAAAPRGVERRRQRRHVGCRGVLLCAPAPCQEAALLPEPWVARALAQGSRSLKGETACICTAMERQASGAPWRAACQRGSSAHRLRGTALGPGRERNTGDHRGMTAHARKAEVSMYLTDLRDSELRCKRGPEMTGLGDACGSACRCVFASWCAQLGATRKQLHQSSEAYNRPRRWH